MGQNLTSEDLARFLGENQIKGEILHLEAPTPTVQAAAAAVNAQIDQIVKTLLFLINDEPIIAIACGIEPVDRRPIAGLYGVGKKRVKLATAEQVLETTGYVAGAVPPFGHRHPSPTLLDPRVLDHESVYAGGGEENALVRLSTQSILSQTKAEVIDLISPIKPT